MRKILIAGRLSLVPESREDLRVVQSSTGPVGLAIMEKEDMLDGLHYMPIVIFIALPTTFIVTYVIAVLLGHVEAGFPYISDSAAYPPESCIFAQFINMSAALLCCVIYIRYSQITKFYSAYQLNASLPKLNKAALVFGLTASLGLSMVANFQETTVIVVHLLGAFICFGVGTAYFWTQVVCSYYMHPLGCTARIAHLRLALAILCTVCFIIGSVTAVLAQLAYNGTNPRKWYKEDGGWELHVASTAMEWFCAIMFCTYILTFVDEFKGIELTHPKIMLKSSHLRNSNEVLTESQESVPPLHPRTIT